MPERHKSICIIVCLFVQLVIWLNITVNHTEALGLVVMSAPVEQSLSGLLAGNEKKQKNKKNVHAWRSKVTQEVKVVGMQPFCLCSWVRTESEHHFQVLWHLYVFCSDTSNVHIPSRLWVLMCVMPLMLISSLIFYHLDWLTLKRHPRLRGASPAHIQPARLPLTNTEHAHTHTHTHTHTY